MWTILQFIKGRYHQPRGFVRFCEVTALETLQPLHTKNMEGQECQMELIKYTIK